MTKNIKFVITRFVFFSSSKCTKIQTPLGSLRRSPRRPSRLGRGIPPPYSPSRSTPSAKFGVSNSAPTAPRFSGDLN